MRIEQIGVVAACAPTGLQENAANNSKEDIMGTLTLYDYAGRKLVEKNNVSDNDIEKLDLPVGFYLYTITKQGRLMKKGKISRL